MNQCLAIGSLSFVLDLVVYAIYFFFIAQSKFNIGATVKEVGWPFKTAIGISFSLQDYIHTKRAQARDLFFSVGFWLNFGSYFVFGMLVWTMLMVFQH